MSLKSNGDCAKGCDPNTENAVVNATTGKRTCVVDTNPRLKIVWGSKKEEKELMDDEKVQARKTQRKAALTSGDSDGDAIEAAALGKTVDQEAAELESGLQDPMQDLVLRAEWTQSVTGNFEYTWAARQGVDDPEAFFRGINLNTNVLTVPSANLVGVDLKAITIAVKARKGTERFETEFSFNMHKKPEITFQMPDSVEAAATFTININFDGAKLDRADVYVIKVPAAGYQDPETGVVITEKDAKKQIEDVENKNKNKLYTKKSEKEQQKQEKQAAGGDDQVLKQFAIRKSAFTNGLKWWKKAFALRPSKQDFNVLLKLQACGNSGCFVRR
jgi:hypothetical protein